MTHQQRRSAAPRHHRPDTRTARARAGARRSGEHAFHGSPFCGIGHFWMEGTV